LLRGSLLAVFSDVEVNEVLLLVINILIDILMGKAIAKRYL